MDGVAEAECREGHASFCSSARILPFCCLLLSVENFSKLSQSRRKVREKCKKEAFQGPGKSRESAPICAFSAAAALQLSSLFFLFFGRFELQKQNMKFWKILREVKSSKAPLCPLIRIQHHHLDSSSDTIAYRTSRGHSEFSGETPVETPCRRTRSGNCWSYVSTLPHH